MDAYRNPDFPTYPIGEAITKERIQDEPWYSDFQTVCEVMTCGEPPYELRKNGLQEALKDCRKALKIGPPGWTPPSNDRLRRWIKSCWIDDVEQVKNLYQQILDERK